ncbi:PAS domain S-box protein [Horticoccus sp. 23ND18S-11]|uniref:PAS domain S-box protein n=1 Tax=Horticoccus sp. 23ND18S-11 TaxID=3391832 RepID=UPI0039C8D6E4
MKRHHPAPPPAPRPEDAGKYRILVVEDEAVVARDVQMQLSEMGYLPVGHATRGEQAVTLAGETRPDLVLMDIQLAGGMDGIATAQAIRTRHGIPIIFLTAYADDSMLARAKLTDPCGYLLKPFSERDLRTALEMALYKQKTDAQLRASEELYRNLTAQLQVGVVIHAPDTSIILSNPKAAELLGMSDDQLRGRSSIDPAWNVVRTDGTPFPGTEHPVAVAIATRRPVRDVEMGVFRPPTQDRVWLLVNADPQFNPDGSIRQVIVSFADITARKQAEGQLRVNDVVLRAVSQGVFITSPDRQIVSVNDAFVAITGYAKTEIAGKDCHFLQGPLTDPRTVSAINLALRHAVEFSGEIYNYRKDGTAFWNEFTFSPVRDEHGQLTHYIGVTRDITERKRAEDILRASREQLRAFAQRLQVIREEERTRIAREIHDVLAQELTRLKLDLAWLGRRIAHPVDEGTRTELAQKLSSMIELADVTLESVQTLATDLRPVVLDSLGLGPALEWLAEDFQRRTGIPCTAGVAAALPPVERAQATALFRIVQESLTNVIRHAAAKRVEVTLASEHGRLRLEVRDDGRGITPEELENPKSIGLLGMRERAALLGGETEIAPAPGGGTVVRVTTPLAAPAAAPLP